MDQIVHRIGEVFELNGRALSGLETAADAEENLLEQRVELYLGPRGEDKSVFYIREVNDLLYNAAFKGGKKPSSRLPALSQAAKKRKCDATGLYLVLKEELSDPPDAILQDEVAGAILAAIAFYGGIRFEPLNSFDKAYSSVTEALRERLRFQAYNDGIYEAFKGLLDAGYIAQGIIEGGKLAIVATKKLDQYLQHKGTTSPQPSPHPLNQ